MAMVVPGGHEGSADRLPAVVPDRGHLLRAEIDASIDTGDAITARTLLEHLWRRHPGPATAAFVLGRIAQLPADPSRRRATVAVVRSFTVEPIVPVLRAAAAVNAIDLDVRLGEFGTYGQDLLDPSRPIHADWRPDVVIVATQTRDVAPELWERFAELTPEGVDKTAEHVIDHFTGLVEGFRRLSAAALVLHGLDEPPFTALGVADAVAARSQRDVISTLNDRLRKLAAAYPDVHLLDYDAVVSRAGRSRWFDEHKWQAMRMPIRSEHLADLADEWLRYVQPAIGKVVKALAVDLDGTLWGGVIGEDGIEGIELGSTPAGAGYRALQRALLDLTTRGILLAVCSKNNHADAIEVLQSHPDLLVRPSDFAAIRANWDSKVDNLRSIAAELNIGLDSIAFLDDNPFECDLVRRALPEVTVIELDRPPTATWNVIVGNPLFERPRMVDEDRARAQYYADQSRRREALDQADSLNSYLHSLDTVVTIFEATSRDVPRLAQLTQKTNQFNLTTRRYSEVEINALLDSSEATVLVASARDRFGDHGTIGMAILHTGEPAWIVDTMLLSCRVIGRGIEVAVMSVVLDLARRRAAHSVIGTFIRTAKNEPARDFYREVGFDRVDLQDEPDPDPPASDWRWTVDDRTLAPPPWIAVRTSDESVAR